MKKAVFIDKDGTLIKDVPYNVDPKLVQLEDTAGEALLRLKQHGYLLMVISNQDGVAKGLFTQSQLLRVNDAIQNQLAQYKVSIDKFFYCPHSLNAAISSYAIDCDCRKPKPGLILKAIKEFDIDPGMSWMIGDILNDVEAGTAAGCRAILIDNGNETEWVWNKNRIPAYSVKNLKEAAEKILAKDSIKKKMHDSAVG